MSNRPPDKDLLVRSVERKHYKDYGYLYVFTCLKRTKCDKVIIIYAMSNTFSKKDLRFLPLQTFTYFRLRGQLSPLREHSAESINRIVYKAKRREKVMIPKPLSWIDRIKKFFKNKTS